VEKQCKLTGEKKMTRQEKKYCKCQRTSHVSRRSIPTAETADI